MGLDVVLNSVYRVSGKASPIAAHSVLSCVSFWVGCYVRVPASMTMEGFESTRAFDDIQVRNGMFYRAGQE